MITLEQLGQLALLAQQVLEQLGQQVRLELVQLVPRQVLQQLSRHKQSGRRQPAGQQSADDIESLFHLHKILTFRRQAMGKNYLLPNNQT